MADPYQCLRCSSIVIGIYNILYCFIQYGILGWQVGVVRERQWEYENRMLPATGFVDGFQARFPGLYAIYTETPDRRRTNAMFTIVLICLFLSIIHFFTTSFLLYGCVSRRPGAIMPWFFTAIPLSVMCTAYAVLWWSGDIFNEQLTMSVAEFVMSCAVNGVAIVIVLFYYYRLTGQLTSDKPRAVPPFHTNTQKYPANAHRVAYEPGAVPLWRTEWPKAPEWLMDKKLRRRERLGTPARPICGPARPKSASAGRKAPTVSRVQSRSAPQTPKLQQRQVQPPASEPAPVYTPEPRRKPPAPQSIREYTESPSRGHRHRHSRSASYNSRKHRARSSSKERIRRKSPQRVSFKSKPKVYERTPDSSVSSGRRGRVEMHTVV